MIYRSLAVLFVIGVSILGCALPATTKKLPGQSIANSQLQRDTMQLVALKEVVADNTCKQRKVINTEIVDSPKTIGKDPWTERWTVDRCGNMVQYKINFTPDQKGGTDFTVSNY